jgi:hypothetical protein
MYHFPSRSMIAVNSLWSVCFDMYLSYRGRDPRTSGEASDREGHESKIADRRARTMPIDTRRTTTSEERESDSVFDQRRGQSRKRPGRWFESVRGSRTGQAASGSGAACFVSRAILWMMSNGGLKAGATVFWSSDEPGRMKPKSAARSAWLWVRKNS